MNINIICTEHEVPPTLKSSPWVQSLRISAFGEAGHFMMSTSCGINWHARGSSDTLEKDKRPSLTPWLLVVQNERIEGHLIVLLR